jgi:hypothetical protein
VLFSYLGLISLPLHAALPAAAAALAHRGVLQLRQQGGQPGRLRRLLGRQVNVIRLQGPGGARGPRSTSSTSSIAGSQSASQAAPVDRLQYVTLPPLMMQQPMPVASLCSPHSLCAVFCCVLLCYAVLCVCLSSQCQITHDDHTAGLRAPRPLCCWRCVMSCSHYGHCSGTLPPEPPSR